MAQNTFDYMDELQRRLDEVLRRPVQGDYQEGPGAAAHYWDLLKQGLGEAMQWRAGQTTPYNMEAYMNPSDEQLMSMIPMAGPMKNVKGNMVAYPNPKAKPEWWNKATPATGERWAAENPGITDDKFYWGLKNLKNAIAEMFEPEKLGSYAPSKYAMEMPKGAPPTATPKGKGGPSAMSAEEMKSLVGPETIPGLESGAGQYSFNAENIPMPYATQRYAGRPDALQQRVALEAMGITDRASAQQAGSSIPRTPPQQSVEGSPWTQQYDAKEAIVGLLAKLVGADNLSAFNRWVGPEKQYMSMSRALAPLLGILPLGAAAYKYPFPSNIDMSSLDNPNLRSAPSAQDIEQRGMRDPNFGPTKAPRNRTLEDEMLAKRISLGLGY